MSVRSLIYFQNPVCLYRLVPVLCFLLIPVINKKCHSCSLPTPPRHQVLCSHLTSLSHRLTGSSSKLSPHRNTVEQTSGKNILVGGEAMAASNKRWLLVIPRVGLLLRREKPNRRSPSLPTHIHTQTWVREVLHPVICK